MTLLRCLLFLCLTRIGLQADATPAAPPVYETRSLLGWTVQIREELLAEEPVLTEQALELLKKQLEEIVRDVPAPAVVELKKVPLYFSPPPKEGRPGAAFHPNVEWLRKNGRDPQMAMGVEFTNVRIFEKESRRMPSLALHELAHAYHHRVLRMGAANLEVKNAYQKANASGRYEQVERHDAEGRTTIEKAYGMNNPMEYFAETTEAYFGRNDFFPFTRDELKQHDPEMLALLEKLWGVK